MNNKIILVAGDPNSVNSELIFKCWKKLNESIKKKIYLLGSYSLILKQSQKLNLPIKIAKVSNINETSDRNILKIIDKEKKVYPNPDINKIIQNRKLEKSFVNDLGIQTTEWAFIEKVENVSKNKNLLPGILKTNTLGYDGHGQFVLNSLDDIKKDWCFTADYILEKKVDLMKEISVILTRYQNGAMSIYEPIENMHKNQILKHSKIPAEINDKIFKEALESAKKIAESLNYVGTMAVEYFINKNNDLLLNEIAPRVHNSGHLTINAFNISQFEGHIRAVCNLEIIAVGKNSKAAEMINILGKEIEEYRLKNFNENEFFFDYGKKEIKDKRKMGHLTILKKVIT